MTLCEGTKISCVLEDEEEQITFSFDNISTKQNIRRECNGAVKLSLLEEKYFSADGLSNNDINWLLSIEELNMCITIHRTDYSSIRVGSKSIKGDCTGAILSIVNNEKLEYVIISPKLLDTFIGYPEKPIIVRGNRILDGKYITALAKYKNAVDIQEKGECAMPQPFTMFVKLNSDCKSLYGTLVVDPALPFITLPPSFKRKFKYEGCVQIENTNLADVQFLEAFHTFKPTPYCRQYIRWNRMLCVKNMKFIAEVFVDIRVHNNLETCSQQCVGGVITERFLAQNAGCKYVFGDLKIVGWKEKPVNVESLRGIRSIEGRLIITNNADLGNFTYFSNLRKVGTQSGDGKVIIIRNNPDLTGLPMPRLRDITISEDDPRVELINNPMMEMRKSMTTTKKATKATGVSEASTEEISIDEPETQNPTGFEKGVAQPKRSVSTKNEGVLEFLKKHKWFVVLGAVTFCLIFLCLILLILILMLKKKTTALLPPPPYKLSKQSKEVLASICKDIMKNNPMVWCVQDRYLLWQSGRSAAGGSEECSVTACEALKPFMIPLAANASVPAKKEVEYNRPLQKRIQQFFDYEYVVMVGSKSDITRVVPRLPSSIGGLALYIDGRSDISIAYKLLGMLYLSTNILLYKYEARNVHDKSHKLVNVLFYQWGTKRLPTEFTELLQLLRLCSKKKVICVSDRRKEVFSLLYLVFMQVSTTKEVKNIAETFQQHLQLCNGAPLDRHEMLYVMRFLLDWAQQASCIPSRSEKKHANWCQVYAQMSTFSQAHPSVMNIQPQHLPGDTTSLEEEVNAAYASSYRFLPERPRGIMRDSYRRRSEDDKKRDANLQAHSDVIPSDAQDEELWADKRPTATTRTCSTRSDLVSRETQEGFSREAVKSRQGVISPR
ncbi:hypothetical protein Y032_0223g2654 [Ancylostoma ceylanicum]|nr:hypothetical protein Y032_0223g2654 [Ancylostoma ceylanicum]